MSWFWRGFQSAIFYYLSCAPCSKLAYRRRRRKLAQRAQAEKLQADTDIIEQGLYDHPTPFSTNVYWREEMALGPGPPQRKGNRDRDRERLRSESNWGLRLSGQENSSLAGTSSADTVVVDELAREREAEHVRFSGDGWNRRRYQREDEMLWGIDLDARPAHLSPTSSNNDRGATATHHYYARNPAVNDLHPPVVSATPQNRSETQWMLQPPPSARIMEGKQRAARSRSGSGTSNGSDASRKRGDTSLGRKVGERLMEEKVRKG